MMRLLCCWLLAGALVAVETPYRPSDHPASVERRLVGFAEPAATLHLAAEYPGRLAAIAVAEGAVVGADASTAFRLDTAVVEQEVAAARAGVAQASAALQRAQAAQALAEGQRAFAERELDRVDALALEGPVAEQERDRLAWERDRAGLAVAEAAAQISVADAQHAQAEARLAQARERLARHAVAAPAGWTVIEHLQQPGALVGPQVPVLALADLRRRHIAFLLSDRELRQLQAAAPVTLTLPQDDDRALRADIVLVDAELAPASRKVRVELGVDGTQLPALGAPEVHLTLHLSDPEGGLLIPQRLVETTWEQRFVHSSGGERLPITVLRSQGEHVVIAPDALPADIALVPPPQP